MENEKIFGLYATVSRLSHHCFGLCDKEGKSSQTSTENKCIKSCVEFSLTNRNLLYEKITREYPEANKHNKSLEFKSFFNFT
jgi:hypothetical protein